MLIDNVERISTGTAGPHHPRLEPLPRIHGLDPVKHMGGQGLKDKGGGTLT